MSKLNNCRSSGNVLLPKYVNVNVYCRVFSKIVGSVVTVTFASPYCLTTSFTATFSIVAREESTGSEIFVVFKFLILFERTL